MKSHMSLTQKGVWAYIGITIVEIIFVAILAAGSMRGLLWVVIYIILKWLCIVGIVAYLIQTQELYKCAKEMAEGNLDRKADTSKMFWVFRAHGEHLNQIRDGMSKAVEARIKSEHLKTELITNVSHDIKTPLTSIINYVDLLQKGDMDEKTRQEYIEVLSRQSARLKKTHRGSGRGIQGIHRQYPDKLGRDRCKYASGTGNRRVWRQTGQGRA